MNLLTKYAHRRFETLIARLKQYEDLQEPETLHGIRLEIKKLKSLFHLANASVKKFKAHRNFLTLRAIFRRAGVIRKVDLFYELFLHYEIQGVTDTMVPASKDQTNHIAVFQKNGLHDITLVHELEKKLNPSFRKIHRDDLMRYLKKRKTELKPLMYPKLNQRDCHKSRKIIKEILYLSDISKKTKKNLNPFFDKVQEAIGQWHDKQMLIPLLRKIPNELEVQRLKAESRADLISINSLVSGFYGLRQ